MACVYLHETQASLSRAALDSEGRSRAGRIGIGFGCRFGPNQRYELGRALGVGGTSVVHRVRDRRRGSMLAGKFALATPDGCEAALLREGAMLARLQHENIIALIDDGCEAPAPYLLLEYARGNTLADSIARRRISALHATSILSDVVSGLVHCHQQGILHLDIKPSNVILLPTGRAKIIDFGAGSMPMQRSPSHVAGRVSGHAPSLLEGVGSGDFVRGTVQYMAPEQWSLQPSHPGTDLWAAGLLYYELLTGQLPFGTQPTCLRLRSLGLDCVPFSAAALGLPPLVEDIFAQTLAREPRDRFASAATLLNALTSVEAILDAGPR